MDKYTRNLFGETCPYTALPCKYGDLDCKDCGVEKEEREEIENQIEDRADN